MQVSSWCVLDLFFFNLLKFIPMALPQLQLTLYLGFLDLPGLSQENVDLEESLSVQRECLTEGLVRERGEESSLSCLSCLKPLLACGLTGS